MALDGGTLRLRQRPKAVCLLKTVFGYQRWVRQSLPPTSCSSPISPRTPEFAITDALTSDVVQVGELSPK